MMFLELLQVAAHTLLSVDFSLEEVRHRVATEEVCRCVKEITLNLTIISSPPPEGPQ